MKIAIASATLLALLAGAAAAQDVHCDDEQSQAAMNACSSDDLADADKLLNAAYRKAMKRMEETDKDFAGTGPEYIGAVEALKKAQRGWIAYRDGQCEGVGFALRGGSAEPMVVNGCMAELSRARAKELDQLLNDE